MISSKRSVKSIIEEKSSWKAYVLILSLLLPTTMIWSYFSVRKHIASSKVEARRNDGFQENELKTLTFAHKTIKTDLKWEHSKEFEYRGEMYDIVSSSETKDSITYVCYWDKEETKIKKQINNLAFENIKKSTNHQDEEKKVLEYLKQIYYLENTDPTLCNLISIKYLKSNHSSFEGDIAKIFYSVPFPPPEFL